MMRIVFIAVWVTLAAGALGAMFHITFEVEQLEARLHKLNREIVREQETKHVLQAEWSYFNRPQRLQALTRELLPNLIPIETDQFVTFERLPKRGTDPILAKDALFASPAYYVPPPKSAGVRRTQ